MYAVSLTKDSCDFFIPRIVSDIFLLVSLSLSRRLLVFNSAGIFTSDLVDAMEECVNSGAKVINMSLGGPGRSWLEERQIKSLYDRGVLLVAASGNSGDAGNPVEYPAAYSSVMSVGAADNNKKVAGFSTWNDQLSLAAPGVEVASLGKSSDR